MPTSSEIRQQFIDFFVQKHGHTFVPSSSVVPHGDDTLLFTNAGMNQFKDVFLGTGTRPYKRAANTQKCIRAGGKHNDLDDVGKDTYHHTFFEMLGNWSFGDYFKKEAIAWAWELLTDVWKMDKSRLHVTIFEGDPDNNVPRDDEARQHWLAVGVDPSHIHLGNKKDNFWEMGETGPCGPCTEIHYDSTPDKSGGPLVNKGSDKVIEIWNLVFIQFNRNADKSLTPLPAKHVDTGMGFERVTKILQGKESNYDTDVFTPIFDAIQKVTGAPKYTGKMDDLKDTAYRVIADHIRTLTFALTDGAVPSNEKRGYVVRSVLRRAVRFGWQQFARNEPFLYEFVPTIVAIFSGAFPELNRDPNRVALIIHEEEEGFLNTLERAIHQFQRAAIDAIGDQVAMKRGLLHRGYQWNTKSEAKARMTGELPATKLTFYDRNENIVFVDFPSGPSAQREFIQTECAFPPKISGKNAFDLHTEQGLFIDIAEQMAAEIGLTVDRSEYGRLYLEFRQASGKDRKKNIVAAIQGDLPKTDDSMKYSTLKASASILGWIEDNTVVSGGLLLAGKTVGLILDQTCFYAEQGGQVGDVGTITGGTGTFMVENTQKLGDTVLHIGSLREGMLEVGQDVKLAVTTPTRLDTMRNHTATHLLNLALRNVLGDHIDQKGSLVDHEKTRFDFSHDKPLSPEQVEEVERIVNEQINQDRPVTPVIMPLGDAKKLPGVRAVFGEKYPDPVRVLMIGPEKPEEIGANDSIEFCGGTHLSRTGQAGLFKIVSQEAVGKGVRRVTAVTGSGAVAAVRKMSKVVGALTDQFRCSPDELPARVEGLQEELKKLQAQVRKGVAGDLNGTIDKLLAEAPEFGGTKAVIGELPGGTMEQVRQQTDRLISKAGSCVIVLGWKDEGKVFLRAVVTNDVTAKVHAGNLIKEIVAIVGGKGGGKADKAEAGGSLPEKLGDALELARKRVAEQLAK
jgi:alanyl-tRNA synthetase